MWNYNQMMVWFSKQERSSLLRQADWGIERESQRVTPVGDLALTDHPTAFGNKLTNPYITTDFAESQLELITPPLCSIDEVHAKLVQIHDEVEGALGTERLWPLSMPPRLPSEDLISIAKYDDTPEGQASSKYRQDLADRYGKKMQMISGLHVNFSFHPELLKLLAAKMGNGEEQGHRDNIYFAMSRNFLRYRWLLIYLFGASPTVDTSYDSVICSELDLIEQCFPECCPTVGQYEKYATSLRVSRYGYSNASQRDISLSFDNLAAHISGFRKLLRTTINNESEFYSSIRLKPHMKKGERYLTALEKRGVRYAEVRLLDLNPFVREGISLQQLRVLHIFMIWCLFEESPTITTEEYAWIHDNHHMVSLFGRRPHLQLEHYTYGQTAMTTWMEDIFEKLKELAVLLDGSNGAAEYQCAIEDEYAKVKDIGRITSAKMVKEMKENNEDFLAYGIRLTEMNRSKTQAGCI